MKNVNLILSTLGVLTLSVPAFAGHGVERILPADASHVTVAAVTLDQSMSGQTLINDGNDGPVYENNYSPVLSVVITYDSKDKRDDATGLDEDGNETVVGGPTLSFNLPVTAAEVAAIKAHTLDPKTLVSTSVAQATVQFNNPTFTDACRFSNDSSQPENPSCIQNVTSTEVRPVLSVDRK